MVAMLAKRVHLICASPYVVLVNTDLNDLGIFAKNALWMPKFEISFGLQFSRDIEKLTVLITKRSIHAMIVA
jgi:hypothetical protein